MPEITQTLELSTAHITYETDRWLAKQATTNRVPVIVVYVKQDAGFWIPVITLAEYADMGFEQEDLPRDLLALYFYALGLGVKWIMLDRDAPVDANLPTYEWPAFPEEDPEEKEK